MDLKKRFHLDPLAFKRTALFSLLFILAAHAFCFFNLTYTSGSVMLNIGSGRSAQIANGQYLLPIYASLRGGVSSPFFIGLLSALYLTLTVCLCAWLLDIAQPLPLFALCGTMTANAAVISICAGSLNTADAAFLALLLSALAACCCLRVRFGTLPAAALLAGALALEPSAGSFFAALTMIALLGSLLAARDVRAFLRGLAMALAALLIGAALYYAGDLFFLRRNGLEQQAALCVSEGGLAGMWLAPIRALLSPLTAYAKLSVLLRVLLAVLAVLAVAASACRLGAPCAALTALGALLLPLCCNLPCFSGADPAQITPAYCLLDVLIIVLLVRLAPRPRVQKLSAGAFGILFLGSIVFSNQVYLKKNLELESTLSYMTRVVERIEEAEGYRPGYTPVAFIGTPEDSAFSVERKGFEHLSALDAASVNYAIASDDDMIWYGWQVLGYPFSFVSTYELEQLKENETVKAMPAYPQEGCCEYVGDTLVVKLS